MPPKIGSLTIYVGELTGMGVSPDLDLKILSEVNLNFQVRLTIIKCAILWIGTLTITGGPLCR